MILVHPVIADISTGAVPWWLAASLMLASAVVGFWLGRRSNPVLLGISTVGLIVGTYLAQAWTSNVQVVAGVVVVVASLLALTKILVASAAEQAHSASDSAARQLLDWINFLGDLEALLDSNHPSSAEAVAIISTYLKNGRPGQRESELLGGWRRRLGKDGGPVGTQEDILRIVQRETTEVSKKLASCIPNEPHLSSNHER